MPEPGGPPTSSEIVFDQGEDGRSRIQVRLDGGSSEEFKPRESVMFPASSTTATST
jgi:hypothetical protein